MNKVVRWITHGGEVYMTTRVHRIKCDIRGIVREAKECFRDWYYERTYVPLRCLSRGEIRTIRWDGPDGGLIVTGRYGNAEYGWLTHVKVVGDPGGWALPPGIESIGDLPHFSSADECSTYAHENEAWVRLQA